MKDRLDRNIDYLRLSVTDRCNLRCVYCMPEEGIPPMSHDDILSIEELLHLARLMVEHASIRKIRITGGEPLVRRGVVSAVRMLSTLPLSELVMTTNGLLLEKFAERLAKAGLQRVNVSLDSLSDEKLVNITRRNITLNQIQNGIRAAEEAGLAPVKVNCVVLRGVNDDEITDFLDWSRRTGVQMRFIEHMPTRMDDSMYVSADEILARISGREQVEPLDWDIRSTDRLFSACEDGHVFGIIAPFSYDMCGRCRRIRLTAAGELVTCLSGAGRLDLRSLLRSGTNDSDIIPAIEEAIWRKPAAHGGCGRMDMWKLGG